MAKKSKILIFFLLIALALALYLVLTSESVKKDNGSGDQAQNQTSERLEEEYLPKSAELFKQFGDLISRDDFTAEKITELKNKLLELKVPAKFKDLHVKFFMALTKMENYLSANDEAEKAESRQTINQLKADYSFLNN